MGETDMDPGGPVMPEEAPVVPAAPVEAAPVAPEAPTAPVEAAQNVGELPDWAQKLIGDVRKEAADYRTQTKTAADKAQQEMTDKIAVALGLKPDAAADPTVLTESLTKAQQDARLATTKLAVYQAASQNSGNPAALLDSNTFLADVARLDPASETYSADISSAVQAAIAKNPLLKAAQAAAASGTELGGTGETGQITDEQLARMSPEEITKALKTGRLAHLL